MHIVKLIAITMLKKKSLHYRMVIVAVAVVTLQKKGPKQNKPRNTECLVVLVLELEIVEKCF